MTATMGSVRLDYDVLRRATSVHKQQNRLVPGRRYRLAVLFNAGNWLVIDFLDHVTAVQLRVGRAGGVDGGNHDTFGAGRQLQLLSDVGC